MSYKPGGSYYGEFVTSNPTTGAAVNADALPVATANRNGADDAGFALTVTNLDAGRYKVTGTVPAGYIAADVVFISIAATVAGVAAKSVIDSFLIYPAVNMVQANSTTILGYDGVMQAATANTFTLAATDTAPNQAHRYKKVTIVGNTGNGQARIIIDHNSTTKVCIVDRNWDTIPDATSQYSFGDTATSILTTIGLDLITIETGVNARQALSPILAAAAGKVSGAGTGTVIFTGGNVVTTRITATTDSVGNRSAVTLTLPA